MSHSMWSSSLTGKVYDILFHRIAGMNSGNTLLPGELELSKSLGVSRATVRDALKELSMQKLICTVKGKGTFGRPSVIYAKNRLDVNSDFIQMLQKNYTDVHVSQTWKENDVISPSLLARISGEIPPNTHFLTAKWLYVAQEKARLFGRYYLCTEYIVRTPDLTQEYKSLPDFSTKYMEALITHCSMYSRVKYDDEAASQFELPSITPLLCWDEEIYDVNDNRVGYGEVFVHPENMVFSIVSNLTST